LKLKPNDGYITDSLGWVLFHKGQFKDAVVTLEGAYKLKPDESIIAEHLGDAYLRNSLRDKARQMYVRAVNLESDETNITKIKQKIANIDSTVQQSQYQEKSERTPSSSGQ
jgi:Flp pilus assembly protein TadD